MNKDTVIGIVGSTLLVAAMVVVFLYERAHAPDLDGSGMGEHVAEASLSGSVARGASDSKTDHVIATGPHNLTFDLSWTAGNGKDTLKLTVTPPPGTTGLSAQSSQPTDSGHATVTVPIGDGVEATGNWTVKVEFTSASPASLPGGIPPPAGGMTDSSVSYTVAVKLAA